MSNIFFFLICERTCKIVGLAQILKLPSFACCPSPCGRFGIVSALTVADFLPPCRASSSYDYASEGRKQMFTAVDLYTSCLRTDGTLCAVWCHRPTGTSILLNMARSSFWCVDPERAWQGTTTRWTASLNPILKEILAAAGAHRMWSLGVCRAFNQMWCCGCCFRGWHWWACHDPFYQLIAEDYAGPYADWLTIHLTVSDELLL